MKQISTSILSIKENIKENIKKLDDSNIDYIHLDIMDGNFVSNKTWQIDEISELILGHKKELDVHLMVSDLKKYIDDFSRLNPSYLTFHFEATRDSSNVIAYIQNKGIKAGISIKPATSVEEIKPYLNTVDLVLIMSVEPGKGGQKFINDVVDKIDELERIRKENNYHYVIEVDGGITNETSKLCSNADILVVGTYITSSDNYNSKINEIKSSI